MSQEYNEGFNGASDYFAKVALASEEIIKQSVAMYRSFREDNPDITHLEVQESCETFEYNLRKLLPKRVGGAE